MVNPTILSPCNSTRRSSSASNSPEFEFWMIRNPSCPEPTLHSADQLFSGGLLLPLHQIPADPQQKTAPTTSTEPPISPNPDPPPGSESGSLSDLSSNFTASKRWKDIFKKNPENREKEKKKKKEKIGFSGGGTGAVGAAELNINLWPFSRSRSAGNGGGRPRTAAVCRKVSSAPCSRSNSAGESKSRKWPSSPGRGGGGVHLGRSSPVWQVKRVGSGRSLHDNLLRGAAGKEKVNGRSKKSMIGDSAGAGGGKAAKSLNLNVPTCIGYRHHLGCKNDGIPAPVAGGDGGVASRSGGAVTGGEGARGSNLFNLRSFFTKKVY